MSESRTTGLLTTAIISLMHHSSWSMNEPGDTSDNNAVVVQSRQNHRGRNNRTGWLVEDRIK